MKISKDKGKAAEELLQMLTAWQEQAAKLTTEEISREEYDQWRYNYPKFDTTQQWANVPSKELSDALVKTFKDKLKTDILRTGVAIMFNLILIALFFVSPYLSMILYLGFPIVSFIVSMGPKPGPRSENDKSK